MNKTKQLRSDVARTILHFEEISEFSSGKAKLAKLRNSMTNNRLQDVTPILFSCLSEDLLGYNDKLNYEELAFLTTLQIYALNKQGSSMLKVDDKFEFTNLGDAFGLIKNQSSSIDKRFTQLITADTFESLVFYIRQMLSILKSTKQPIYINYSNLVADLYSFLLGYKENIQIKWARNYYKQNMEKKHETE